MYTPYLLKRLCRKHIFIAVFLAILMLCERMAAQVPGMRKYTQLDGYTATAGYEMEQDEQGYIWLGTDNGGLSFDGKTFRPAQEVGHSPDAEILSCRPLGQGRVLLLPLSNTPSYLDQGNLVTASKDTFLRQIKLPMNYCRQDPVTGTWWLYHGASKVLYGFSGKKRWRYELPDTGRFPFQFHRIINNKVIGQRCIIPGQSYRLCLYDMHRRTFHYFKDSTGRPKEAGKEIVSGLGSGSEYIATIGDECVKIYHYDTVTNMLKDLRNIAINASHGFMYSRALLLDPDNNLWIKGEQGVVYHSEVHKNANKSCTYRFAEPALINSVFIDRDRNIWISAPDNALYFLSEKHFKNELLTSNWPHRQWTPQAIAGNAAGDLCISYTNHRAITCISAGKKTDVVLDKYFAEGSRHILPAGGNKYILYSQNISVLDMATRTVKRIGAPWLVKNVSMGDSGSLLVATTSGVYYLASILQHIPEPQQIFSGRATAAVMLADKRVLIGTPDGLYGKPALNAQPLKIDHPVLNNSNIVDIQPVKDGGALVGTNAQGLFILMGGDGHIKKIQLKRSNAPACIRRIYRQNDNTYWVATDKGAYSLVFDRNWSVISTSCYTFYDGLPSDNITDIYVNKDTAYFTTTKGLGILPLKDSSRLRMAPPGIYFNTVRTDHTVFHKPDSAISLPYHQNDLLISLSAISYESLGNTGFLYQLYPLHDKWIQTTNPEVRFTGLPPGNYTFRVYALNAKGVRSEHAALLKIAIKPAFWQTLYFTIGILILTGVLFFILLRRYMRRSEKKKLESVQQKRRLAELELEAIKAQINPHFIHNCLNSIKYLNYTGFNKETQKYLGIFAKLIRLTMQYSRQAFITLDDELSYLSHYLELELLRFKDKLQYTITIDPELNRNTRLPAMLLQPYVENALKHGIGSSMQQGEVRVIFQKKEDSIEILVMDNGPGFLYRETEDGLGLYLSQTRAASYNELFDLGIKVSHYNKQDAGPGSKTGAVVKITFKTITNGPIIR